MSKMAAYLKMAGIQMEKQKYPNPLTPDAAGYGKTKRLVKTVKEATQSYSPMRKEDWVTSLTVSTSLF